jgi:L-fuconolactonase
MVTEADWKAWTPGDLKPYFDRVLETFGPHRLMIGTDWPVLTVACGYAPWWTIVEQWTAPLSSTERSLMEGDVAARIYSLDVPTQRSAQPG